MLLGIRLGSLRVKIIAWTLVPTASILIVVGLVTLAAYRQASDSFASLLLVLLALSVVVPAVIVAIGIRRLTRPIEDLINADQEVAGGRFDQTITARTGDEIEELAGQFNRMSAQLRESYAHLEQRVADRTKELGALNAIAAAVSRSLDLEELLCDALAKALEVLEFESGAIYLRDLRTGDLQIRGCQGELSDAFRRVEAGATLSAAVATSGSPLIINDLLGRPDSPEDIIGQGYRSLASIPLISKGQVEGVLTATSRRVHPFRQQDIDLLLSIGHQMGVAIENARLFKAEQRRAEQFELISEVGRRVTSILAIDELLVQLAELIQRTFDYYLVDIGLVEDGELVYRAGAGKPWESGFKTFRLKLNKESVTGSAAVSGAPLIVPDVRQEARYVNVASTHTRSELAVPLKTKEKVIGVLNVESDRLDAFDQSDLAVLQSLASQAAIAIEKARLFRSEQRRAEQFRVISEVGRRITSILDIDELLEQMVRLIQQAFDYYHVGIGLIEGDEVVHKVGAGLLWDDPAFQFKPARLKLGREGITGWVAATGQPLLVPDVSREPRYVLMQGSITRSELAVAISAKGNVIGVLDVQSDRLNAFDESDVAVIQSLADQAGIAVENARLYEQARRVAILEERQRLSRELHDAVTQTLFSASLIGEVLPRLWERDPDEARRRLEDLRKMTRGALAEMRTLLLELRPAVLAESELSDLLRQLAEAITGRTRVPVHVAIEGSCTLPSDVKVALYRIAQEALNNMAKHAGASRATVGLRGVEVAKEQEAGIELLVSDDGCGFDRTQVSSDHLGLRIMRERAEAVGATVTIDSAPGRGTQVTVVWIGEGVHDGAAVDRK